MAKNTGSAAIRLLRKRIKAAQSDKVRYRDIDRTAADAAGRKVEQSKGYKAALKRYCFRIRIKPDLIAVIDPRRHVAEGAEASGPLARKLRIQHKGSIINRIVAKNSESPAYIDTMWPEVVANANYAELWGTSWWRRRRRRRRRCGRGPKTPSVIPSPPLSARGHSHAFF